MGENEKNLPQAGLKVLIVDDEINIRANLAMSLEAMGCQVTQAGSGPEAVAALAPRTRGPGLPKPALGAGERLGSAARGSWPSAPP